MKAETGQVQPQAREAEGCRLCPESIGERQAESPAAPETPPAATAPSPHTVAPPCFGPRTGSSATAAQAVRQVQEQAGIMRVPWALMQRAPGHPWGVGAGAVRPTAAGRLRSRREPGPAQLGAGTTLSLLGVACSASQTP